MSSQRDFTWDKNFSSEEYGLMTGVNVVLRQGEYRMYHNVFGSQGIPRD